MKIYNSTFQYRNAVLKCMTLFFFIFFFSLLIQDTKAQSTYTAAIDSHVKLSIDSNKDIFNDANKLSAQGDFIFKNGALDDISTFNLNMPINKLITEDQNALEDSISFKLTHVMILPIMKMIHVVGILNIAGVSSRTDLEFNFVVNDDQSITLNGAKSIKLDSYPKETTVRLASYLPDNNELKLNMNLIFKNQQPTMLSSK